MNGLLFSSKSEQISLENVLAYNQIRKCDEGIALYSEEILGLKEEIKDILKSVNVSEDYIDIISNYKKRLKTMETDEIRLKEIDENLSDNDSKINEFYTKVKEMESELESLKRVVFDSDDARVIIDTQNGIDVLNKRLEDCYNTIEEINNENTALIVEKEFLKNASSESADTLVEKVEISNDLQRVSLEFDSIVRELELSVREEIEFCMKKINNREREIVKFEDRKSNIIAEYPDVLSIDYDNEMNKLDELFMELCLPCCDFDCDCEFDCNCSEKCECTRENNCGCNCYLDEEEIEEVTVELPEEDDYQDSNEINIDADMVKVESIEKPDLELREVSNAASIAESKEEEIKEESTEVEENTFSSIGSVPYIFSEGESLESIAEKVYPNKDCWKAIYNYNKEEIDKYLIANGMSNDEDTINALAADKYLFAGIQLNIPTDANYRG